MELLSRQLLEAQETERRNLARELHDEIGQLLTVIKMQLTAAQRSSDDAVANDLETAVDTIDDTINQIRSLSLRLRPSVLDDLGLAAAIEWQAGEVRDKAGIVADVDIEPGISRLSSELESVFFRVAQETMTNIMRHSQAKSVSISLVTDDEDVTMTIVDDGVGFDVSLIKTTTSSGLGLPGMRERVELVGGTLLLKSEQGKGTQVRLRCQQDTAAEQVGQQ